MKPRLIDVALAILAAMALAGCSERPDRADPEQGNRIGNETPQHPAHQRTLNQGESERIGN
ncbi:MAG: hypothetical protein ACT4P4_26635 [Betaproteobacteria bacterium]